MINTLRMDQSKEQQMFALIERWEASQLSINEFCEQHDLKYPTFHYWHKKRKNINSSSGFVALQQPCNTTESIEFHYPNGVKLLVPRESSFETLQQLLLLSC